MEYGGMHTRHALKPHADHVRSIRAGEVQRCASILDQLVQKPPNVDMLALVMAAVSVVFP
jgi:hypothetical protein